MSYSDTRQEPSRAPSKPSQADRDGQPRHAATRRDRRDERPHASQTVTCSPGRLFLPPGSRESSQVDVRVVAATNVNIEEAIAKRTFREDLYYRISAFTIVIPPLRERREEIPFLIAEMLRRQAATLQQQPPYLAPQLLDTMQEYDWPGNLRELSNYVLRILILQDQNAVLSDLLTKMRTRDSRSMSYGRRSGELQEFDGMRTIVRNCKDQAESRLIQSAPRSLELEPPSRRRQPQDQLSRSAYKIQQYQLQKTDASPQLRPQLTSNPSQLIPVRRAKPLIFQITLIHRRSGPEQSLSQLSRERRSRRTCGFLVRGTTLAEARDALSLRVMERYAQAQTTQPHSRSPLRALACCLYYQSQTP